MADLHRVRTVADQHAWSTRVWIDEQAVRGVVGVAFGVRLGSFSRDDEEPLLLLTIAPAAVELDGSVPLHVLEHSQRDRHRRSLPEWMARPGWRTRLVRAWREITAP